ncbi:uncharacterized protein LOC122086238 [Macadamia integrifolia]|uniref:uncharacterized protein LOC122086238 n=1 Tax=Macadamia integrifolia TaxID=60698 RepID=UPI001C4E4213|nr:uncharacterized protein LOC122086238 [Macadamia integrifolia]
MAYLTNYKMIMPLFLAFSLLLLQGALGEIVCEYLPNNLCAFSIASSGKRCVLENYKTKQGSMAYQCRTSEVVVERMAELIETDACVRACGVDRKTVGFSSDALLEPQFTSKLCSPSCLHRCPNLVDLYFNLAAGEGVFLPDLCEGQRMNPHRAMMELLSSGVAPGPIPGESSSPFFAAAPAPVSI